MPDLPATRRVVIRVSAGADLGMGHLVRCSHLARGLAQAGLNIVFIVDQYNSMLAPWIGDFKIESLYPHSTYTDQLQDAFLCEKVLLKGDWLVVDDYRLSDVWESKLKIVAGKVIVIDDLANRKHDCHFLIDYRWCNKVEDGRRYMDLVPQDCIQMLGPDYCLLAEEYQEVMEREKKQSPFIVMLSLGGGGNLTLLANLLDGLAKSLTEETIEFWPVIGAFSQHSELIDHLEKVYTNIKPIRNSHNLAEYYSRASLFIGASGTAIYELNCMQLPAILFSLTGNQINNLDDLEDLGHFFQINSGSLKGIDKLDKLIFTIKENYQRVKSLVVNAKVKVDGKGVFRVVEKILAGDKIYNSRDVQRNPKIKPQTNTIQDIGDRYQQELKPGICVRQIKDTEINKYLAARNLNANREKMTVTQVIENIEHYTWWFTNKREIFVLTRDSDPCIYIWHQKEKYGGQDYLIGGWMVACEECSFDVTALALRWQLDYCEKIFPIATWLAIINKENKFVNLLNALHGFVDANTDCEEIEAIEHFFPLATIKEFNYVVRHSVSTLKKGIAS